MPPPRSRRRAIASPIKLPDGVGHVLELCLRQLGIDRQREHLARRLLGHREPAGLVAQVREARLEMQGHRIIDRAADPLRLEMRLKLVESEVRGQLDLTQFMVKPDTIPAASADDDTV